MKYGLFVILMFLSAGAASGQQPVAETRPEVAVIKHSWARERLNWDDAEDIRPGGVSTRQRPRTAPVDQEYRRKEASEQRSARLSSSGTRQPAKDSQYQYTYSVSLRNDSGKKIREIDWDYIFFDEGSREEFGRRQFTSVEKIDAGKTKKLTVRVSLPPTHKISADRTGKDEAPKLGERIEIIRILYDDNSVWTASGRP